MQRPSGKQVDSSGVTEEMSAVNRGLKMDPRYEYRPSVPHYDATIPEDAPWQRKVYALAAKVAAENGLSSVLDIGCGSGEKLIEFLGHLAVCGVEVEPTLSKLRDKYPSGAWMPPDGFFLTYDLVVCSDVIEHVDDPMTIIGSIRKASPKFIVMSTPDRLLVPGAKTLGPPVNKHHVREWTFSEFNEFVSSHFRVVQHLSIPEQFAQVVVAVPYEATS